MGKLSNFNNFPDHSIRMTNCYGILKARSQSVNMKQYTIDYKRKEIAFLPWADRFNGMLQ